MGRSSEAKRGIPRKSFRGTKIAKHQRYTSRSTCFQCKLVFKSPAKKARHVASGHSNGRGVSKRLIAGSQRPQPGTKISQTKIK